MSKTLIVDIETAAFPFDSFDETQQDYLTYFANDAESEEKEKEKLALWGLTTEIVAIGLWDLEREKGTVLYQHPEGEPGQSSDGRVKFYPVDETEMLQRFWRGVGYYQQFVTFNGRRFDYPFLLHRSAIRNVQANRFFVQQFLKSRYNSRPHCDLLDQLSFHGAFSRRFSLDFYCKSFGIESPKEQGMNGKDVTPYFRDGRYRDIAEYCVLDLIATAELYKRWHNTIDPLRRKSDIDGDDVVPF